MRFNFDLYETETEELRTLTPSSTPKEDLQWLPLQNHPVFSTTTTATARDGGATSPAMSNLLAWDKDSRLYFWDSDKLCLHRISIRLGEHEPTSVLAAVPSKVLESDVKINFVVNRISINRTGSAVILAGLDSLSIMYLYGHGSSTKDSTIICRTVSVGSDIYYNSSSVIRTLQVAWHPYSDTHIGILSSDSVFRIFDLSASLWDPEQEYYLQPVEPGRSRNAASVCPVDFSFGGAHLWDKLSVFILYSDGSVYILCPVVPFGSVHLHESILELYNDAHEFGLKSANPTAVRNSTFAISWLEATFPELTHRATQGANLSPLKAHPHALFDASLSLQGPLHKVCHDREEEGLEARGSECEGHAVSLLYSSVSKDSILTIAWSGGQLQIDALADEIQPVWNLGNAPRLRVDSHRRVLGVAMLCESLFSEPSTINLNLSHGQNVWLGNPPPLLRLAIVDLALPMNPESGSLISMLVDPLFPERIFSLHNGGVDSTVLHFLPFTNQTGGKDETMRTPTVHPILSTCHSESSPSPLLGFVAMSNLFGYSWIVGATASRECIVLEMKTRDILHTVHVDTRKDVISLEDDVAERDTHDIISQELLVGPKVVIIPEVSQNLRSVTADSIEGRSTLHQYCKLFHENYVEYAHKVNFELKDHEPHLKKIIDDQHARLSEAEQKLLKVGEKQPRLEERISRAIQRYNIQDERLQKLRNLPGVHRKPLSKAERNFKLELERFRGVELEAFRSSIEAVDARLRKHMKSSQGNASSQQRQLSQRKKHAQESQISLLKDSLAKLSLVNKENSEKVKLVESALKSHGRGSLV